MLRIPSLPFHEFFSNYEINPFPRLTSLRKASSNSEEKVHLTSSRQDLSASTSGTLHTKRHSQEDPNKDSSAPTKSDMMGSLKSAGSMARYGFKYNVNNYNFWSQFA